MAKFQTSTNLSSILIHVLIFLLNLVSGSAIYTPDDVGLYMNDTSMAPNGSFFSINSNANNGYSTNWVARWAAIGDSFTAGIGAGNLWSKNADDVACSRYDKSYVGVLDRAFGDSVKHFQYLACSGARTSDIVEQAKKLESDMDLVVMTAGGNDLCLTDVIKSCIMLPYGGKKGREDAVSKAEANIDSILKPNIREILNELNDKMKHDGVVVYAGYAQYFYDEDKDDDCELKQDFTFPRSGLGYKLTLENRRKFNELVLKTNRAIESVVDEYRQKSGVRYKIRFADWNPWVESDKVAGHMCWPGTTGKVPDPKQPNIQFFKPATNRPNKEDLKKRNDDLLDDAVEPAPEPAPEAQLEAQSLAKRWKERLYNSILYRTGNPMAEALARLTRRGPIIPPGCPTDNDYDFGFGLPDRWGKFFHPNELGHTTLASFVMHAALAGHSEAIGGSYSVCKLRDTFQCFSHSRDLGARYMSPSVVDATYQKYCEELVEHASPNWIDQRVFNEGTHEAHMYTVQLSNGAAKFDKQQCLDSFKHIIYSCDPAQYPNAYGYKHGGKYTRGSYTYQLESVSPHPRTWPLDKPRGKCEGWYKVAFSRYTMRGAGWGADKGEKLKASIKSCIGLGLTDYHFQWLDKPDKDGMEWKATFNTPVFTRRRCFNNNKVQKKAGGITDGCQGND